MSSINVTNIKHPSSASNNVVLDSSGNVRVTTLADSAGSNTSTPAEIASGRAKAWVNFNGTSTVAIRASYNVSSITDNGTGDYTVNFTTAMADANYSAVASCSTDASFSIQNLVMFNSAVTNANVAPTSSAFRLSTRQDAGTGRDQAYVLVSVFR